MGAQPEGGFVGNPVQLPVRLLVNSHVHTTILTHKTYTANAHANTRTLSHKHTYRNLTCMYTSFSSCLSLLSYWFALSAPFLLII